MTTKYIPVQKIGDEFHEVDHELAFYIGGGVDLSLIVRTRFNGNGNASVEYIVKDHRKETSYLEYDAAVWSYNYRREALS
jgi:hypothetical protein